VDSICKRIRQLFILLLLVCTDASFASQADSLETLLYSKSEKSKMPVLKEIVPLLLQTNTQRARSYSLQLLEISRKYQNQESEADALNFLSEINMLTVMDFVKATDYAERALQISEKLNYKSGLGNCYSNLGEILLKQNNFSKAIEYFTKAKKYSGNDLSLAKIYNQIGRAYGNESVFDSAHYYFSQSLQLYNKAKDFYNVARLTNNIADLYMIQNKDETAGILLAECIEMAHKSAPRIEALAYLTWAQLEVKNKNYTKALEYADLSSTLANRLKISLYVLKADKLKADILTKLKRYEEALTSFYKYNELKDSLFNSKNTQIIAEFESNQALDKKQKELDSTSDELKKQSGLQYYLIAGILFVVLVLIILIILIRKSNRKSQEIEKQDEEIFQSNKNITLLNEIGKEITSTLDLEKVFLIIYNRVNELMDAGTFGIGLYSAEKHSIDYRMAIQDGKHYKPYSRDTQDKNQLPVWCIENKKPVFINDIDAEYKNYISAFSAIEFETDGVKEKKTHSYIYIPLLIKKEIQGIITVQSVKKNAYTENDLRLISAIASYASIAIQNSNMFNHVEEMVEHRTYQLSLQKDEVDKAFENIKMLSEIGQEISSSLNLEEILQTIYTRVNSLMDATAFVIGIYNEKEQKAEGIFGIEKSERLPFFSNPIDSKNSYASWCLVHKKEVFINDLDKEHNDYIEGETIVQVGDRPESLIYIPLIVNENAIGYISAQSFRKNAYTERDLNILRTISSYASAALYNSKLYAGLEDKVNERTLEIHKQKEEIETAYSNISILSEIGQEITSTLDLDKILLTIYERVNALMDASVFGIGLYKPAENKIEYQLAIQKGTRYEKYSRDTNDKNQFPVWCIENKKSILINNVFEEYKRYIEKYKEITLHLKDGTDADESMSMIYVPILIKEKVIGLITVQSFSKNAYSAKDLEMLSTIGTYAGIAFENAGITQKLLDQKDEIENANQNIRLLSEIGQQITSTLDLETVLNSVYQNVNKMMDAAFFGISFYNEKEKIIERKLTMKDGLRLPPRNISMDNSESLMVWCVDHKKEIFMNDAEAELSNYVITEYIPGDDTESAIFVPLLVEGKVIGVITAQSYKKFVYSPHHLEILRTFASYAGVALNNAEAYKRLNQSNLELGQKSAELKESYKNITLLAEIGQQITSTLDLDKVLRAVYENVNKLMDAASFVIGYYNKKKQIIEWKLGIEKGEIFPYAFYDMADKNRLAVWCVDHKKEIFINDYNKEHTKYIQEDQPMVAGEDTQSVIYLPLIVDAHVVGTMSVQSFETNAYTLQHLELLRTLASYAAVALNNSEAYNNLNESNLQLEQKSAELEQKKKEIEESNKNLTLLTEIGKEITATLSVEVIIEKVYASVNTLMDANGFGMGIYNEAEQTLDFPGFIENGERLEFHKHHLDEDRLAVLCFSHNQEIVIHDYSVEAPDYLFEVLPPVVGQDALSIIYLPLLSKEKIIGVITVQSFQKNAYTNYHVELLRNLGVYSAIAIENAGLYGGMENTVRDRTVEVVRQKEEIERTYNDIKLLSEIGQQITSTLDLDTIFYKLYENVNRLMDAEVFGVRILHPELNSVEYKFEIESGVRMPSLSVSMDNNDNFSVWCIKNRKEIFVNDLQKEYSRYTTKIHVVSGGMPNSDIFYPLIIGEKVLGAITCQSFKKNAYTKFHLNILKTLASYTAIALDNANAYQELQNVMKKLQSTPQLIQAEKMSSLGQLTAGIAHEINNPVNFISANIQPLRQDMGDIFEVLQKYEQAVSDKNLGHAFTDVEELKSRLDITYVTKEIEQLLGGIEEGARRTTEIVKGLRNFSRLDESVMKKTNIHEGIENTLTLLNTRFKNRIEIIKVYEELPEIECFPGQLNQVFMNILSNAIHAIEGPGTIQIQTLNSPEGILIKIRDSGSGMPEEVKRKIFDPFFTTKDVGVGTGLGLSISFGIIEKHKGKIEVNSEPGKGSEFVISLPL
jgi:transcriptional regulator with GAF, ATPase, and Fis domain